jgi:hypothetical protein
MFTSAKVAPSYRELRPMKAAISRTFPVYPDLVDRLLAAGDVPDKLVAHVLGTCAGYAYADHDTVAMIMARLGLEQNRCLMVAEAVDAMFICSTAFVVQSRCGRVVIVCYRGTQPANFINWLTDADLNPQRLPFRLGGQEIDAELHGGFYRNVRATRYAVIAAVAAALEGKSIVEGAENPGRPPEAIYLTGHSLGGAMAALMGVMLLSDEAYRPIAGRLRAVYTYGQPMVGDTTFAKACATQFPGKFARYVFGHDIVPELPPTASGDFAHFGDEYRLEMNSKGEPVHAAHATGQLTHLSELLTVPFGFLAHQLKSLRNFPLQHSLYDHGPQNYVAALTPEGVRSEFGD